MSDNGRGMNGSGTVRRGGLASKLRMSFVFSAGKQEEKRQSEGEKSRKRQAKSQHRHSSVLEPKLGPDSNKRAYSEQVSVKKETKPQLLPCSSPTQFNPQISKHSLKGKYYYLTLQQHKR